MPITIYVTFVVLEHILVTAVSIFTIVMLGKQYVRTGYETTEHKDYLPIKIKYREKWLSIESTG